MVPVNLRISIAAGGLVLAIATALGCGGDEPEPEITAPTTSISAPSATTTAPGSGAGDQSGDAKPTDGSSGQASGPAEGPGGDPRLETLAREAERTVRALVSALDAGDGTRACALLAPGAIEQIELPRPRGGCAASLDASIGYRDPRGLPVWRGAEVSKVEVSELGPERARLIATVVTRFADRAEVSIEDDVLYLVRSDGNWLVAKPSSTLYRAVGIADVPPSVLSPPAP